MIYIQYIQIDNGYAYPRRIIVKIVISNRSDLPIYAQIRDQIKEQILDGTIKEGTVLPSIRKLAKETGVSVITTTRAYSDLESEGFIASMQGRGSVVLAQDNVLLKEQYLKRVEEGLFSAIATAKAMKMDPDEFMEMVRILWKD